MSELLKREMLVEAVRKDGDGSRIELSLSSESPVDVGDYLEILDHGSGSVDLKRMNAQAPFLLDHDPKSQIGVIEKAWLSADRKLRAIVRFSKNPKAQEVFQDFVDGIRKNVSIGYKRLEAIGEELIDGAKAIRFSFMPYEGSAVSVPADFTVGYGRSVDTNRIQIMTDQINDRQEIEAISKLLAGKVAGIEEISSRAILENWSVQQFRDEAGKRLSVKPITRSYAAPEDGISRRDASQYSLGRAITSFAETGKLEGLEAEMDQEYSRQFGRARGFWVPAMAMTRSLVAGTSSIGGAIVPLDHLGSEFIQALRARSVLAQAGVRFLPGLVGNCEIPKQLTSATASWKTEIEAATQSFPTFGRVSLTPKACTAFVVYSRQLLYQGLPSVDNLVRQDLTAQLALAIDSCVVRGIGGSEPAGLVSVAAAGGAATLGTDVNLVTIGASGGAITADKLIELEAAIGLDNADSNNMKIVTNSTVKGYLRKAVENTIVGTPVWTMVQNADRTTEGRVLGMPALVSNVVPANVTTGTVTAGCAMLAMGSWDQILVGSFGPGLDILTDIFTAAGTRQIKVYASHLTDVAIRNGQSFGVITDITS